MVGIGYFETLGGGEISNTDTGNQSSTVIKYSKMNTMTKLILVEVPSFMLNISLHLKIQESMFKQ